MAVFNTIDGGGFGRHERTCPVRALRRWLDAAAINTGPVFRKVNKAGRVEARRLSEDAVRQILLRWAAQAGIDGSLAEPVSPHGLRAGFVTTAYRNGVSDEEIMGHTRHRNLTTIAAMSGEQNLPTRHLRASSVYKTYLIGNRQEES